MRESTADSRKESEGEGAFFPSYAGIAHYYEKMQLVSGRKWEMESTEMGNGIGKHFPDIIL